MTRRRAGALALMVAAGMSGGCSSHNELHPTPFAKADRGAVYASTRERHASAPTATTAPVEITIVAQAIVPHVGVYDNPGVSTRPRLTLDHPQPSGAPLVFVVREERPAWLEVSLPVRPNGSTGWVRRSDMKLTQHRFRIVVELAAHRITVYQGGTIVDVEPVGLGTRDTPTPGGSYYTKELLRPPNPNGPYGPFAYGLSGFSNVLTDFAGGDGVIGIHGTNDPSLLGHDVSHGCIRMSNAGITKLVSVLPLGVPVDIRP
jgi:lipoprotein-anchoring transpeptidase ErfK/SrfK